MLRRVDVFGLNGKLEHHIKFHSDLNLITGRNGSGKTTLLKLIWYALSGNIERIPREIIFDYADIVGDNFRVQLEWIKRTKGERGGVIHVLVKGRRGKPVKKRIDRSDWERRSDEIDRVNYIIAKSSGRSFFFPTFRRIEGGFAVTHQQVGWDTEPPDFDITESLKEYTSLISVYEHQFIASISTDDVQQLLTRRYADVAERANELHRGLTDRIIATIKRHKSQSKERRPSADRLKRGEAVLNEIHRRIQKVSGQREVVMKPFTLLEQTFKSVFHHRGIRLSDAIVFGEPTGAVRAEQLSAGEKQLLSFLSYNAFTKDAVFFIDEPEISLHADWQRQLFGLLLKQGTGNQFVAATHSPFIYSRYPEREHPLALEIGE